MGFVLGNEYAHGRSCRTHVRDLRKLALASRCELIGAIHFEGFRDKDNVIKVISAYDYKKAVASILPNLKVAPPPLKNLLSSTDVYAFNP